ncbi:MAG TPA: class I SAM-dependent methyltransferase [Candidatus Aminicenantes bacterium]|nr:class I SAM-dependent methyltransferase [Candidatus Aminicenantes bacterium]
MTAGEAACPVCGGPSRFRFRKFGYPFRTCRECGFGRFVPRPADEEIMARYSPEYFRREYNPGVAGGRLDERLVEWHYDYVVTQLARYAPDLAPGRMLDVGCGAGLLPWVFQRRGWQAAGIEINPAGVAYGRETLGLPVFARNIEAPDEDFSDLGTFQLVTLTDFIEHCFTPRRVLDRVFARLAPGGVAFVLTPDLESLAGRWIGKEWAIYSPLEHVSYFTARALTRMLGDAGFSAIRVRHLRYVNLDNVHRKGLRTRIAAAMLRRVGSEKGFAVEGELGFPEAAGDERWYRDAPWPRRKGDCLIALARRGDAH